MGCNDYNDNDYNDNDYNDNEVCGDVPRDEVEGLVKDEARQELDGLLSFPGSDDNGWQ